MGRPVHDPNLCISIWGSCRVSCYEGNCHPIPSSIFMVYQLSRYYIYTHLLATSDRSIKGSLMHFSGQIGFPFKKLFHKLWMLKDRSSDQMTNPGCSNFNEFTRELHSIPQRAGKKTPSTMDKKLNSISNRSRIRLVYIKSIIVISYFTTHPQL